MANLTLREATEKWVQGFYAVPTKVIGALILFDNEHIENYSDVNDAFTEITEPRRNDKIITLGANEYGELDEIEATITERDDEIYYAVTEDGKRLKLKKERFSVKRQDILPVCGTMWSFKSSDNYWLEEQDGIRIMSDHGFRIYRSGNFGYWFGIDEVKYDYIEEYWTPIYLKRGLKWHENIMMAA